MSETDFTDVVGGNGPWQFGIFIFGILCSFPHGFQSLIMTFFAPKVEHWCARPSEVISANISSEQWRNMTIPNISKQDGSFERSSCTFFPFQLSSTNGTLSIYDRNAVPCTSWEYDLSTFKSTLVNEWDLVCDREGLVSMANTVYMVAFLASDIVCGQLSDRFGRRPVLITSLCIFLIAGHATLLSTSYLMFLILRFWTAFGITSTYTISYVILTEVTGIKYRSCYSFAFKFGWSSASMVLAGVAWLIPEWFWLQLAVTLPWISLLCSIWVIPETPRWLLTRGKHEEAEVILLKAAEKNGKDTETAKGEISRFMKQQAVKPENERNITVFDLLRTPVLRKNTLNIYFCWFITSYIYFALAWNTNDLSGNPYVTFFISGALEIPSTAIFLFVSKVTGHRIALMITNIVAGLFLLFIIPVPATMPWMVYTFSMIGKFFINASFVLVYIYSAEIFPTAVRNIGVGTGSMMARVGALFSPFIKQLADGTHPSISLVIPAILSIVSGFMIFCLPETKNHKLPDTLEEGEKFGNSPHMMLKCQ